MTEHASFGTFCFTGCDSGNVAGTGVYLQSDVWMLKGFIGISCATHSRFNMITLQAKSRISCLNVQGYASDRWENKGSAMMVDFPVASGSRLSRLALE
jgi:hypothetical protein